MIRWPRFVPPVGSPIRPRLRQTRSGFDWTFGGRYRPIFVDSGTTALQLAIAAASRRAGSTGTVWTPAYGCPDLVSAAVAADCRTVFYDVEQDLPFFAAGQTPPADLVAAIAAHFVGFAHPPRLLGEAISGHDAILIEDSAQRFPTPHDQLYGDAVVLSFGRGKPLSLMEGGCLLVGNRLLPHIDAVIEDIPIWTPGFGGAAKRWLHDLVLAPAVYGVIRRIPHLAIGKVVYEPAPHARVADQCLERLASQAAVSYLSEQHWNSEQIATESFIERQFPKLRLLRRTGPDDTVRFSRILCLATDAPRATDACDQAARLGCGATRMYGNALPRIEGVPAGIEGPWQRADSLAERVVTFPIMAQRAIEKLRWSS